MDAILLNAIKDRLPLLETLHGGHWGYEDPIYRFYHQSFKAYDGLQGKTLEAVKVFREIGFAAGLGEKLNPYFEEIISEGTGKMFELKHNQHWTQEVRPLAEAFFHVHHIIEMMIKYGKELETAPSCLPSGWATVLYLYNIR